MDRLREVEEIIGHTFKNKDLLVRALTHTSYAHENNTGSYQSLEFLGDSILDFVVAEYLIKHFPKAREGDLTRKRSKVVSMPPLADIIDDMGLTEYIKTSSKTNPSRKIKSDLFESLVAAIYYDSGMAKAKNFIIKFLGDKMMGDITDDDYKSRLYEITTKRGLKLIFKLVSADGPQHSPLYKYEVIINGKVKGAGESMTKKAAQQEAARQALLAFSK